MNQDISKILAELENDPLFDPPTRAARPTRDERENEGVRELGEFLPLQYLCGIFLEQKILRLASQSTCRNLSHKLGFQLTVPVFKLLTSLSHYKQKDFY